MTVRSMRLGVSGGVGSGKSTVCQILQGLGACVIDADAISRASTSSGGSAIAAIRATFGAESIDASGAMDRTQMRQLVFSNPQARTQLEAIIHPLVAVEVERQANSAVARGLRCTVFDIPLLVESRYWRARLDRLLMVDCSHQTQITRVVKRNGLTVPEVEKIIQAQSTRQQRLQAADFVIFNDGKNFFELQGEIESLRSQFGL